MLARLSRCVIAEPFPFVIDLEKSHGMWLATVDGQMLFDWAGFYASRLIGINHPRLYEPEYAARLLHAANTKTANPDFLTPECLEYYELLYELAPRCMKGPELEVYVVNSGAEAVENMMKYFLNLHLQKRIAQGREIGRRRFIYFDQAFHGRTVFALNVTYLAHDPIATRDFRGFDQGNIQVPFPAVDTSAPAEENDERTVATLKIVEAMLQYNAGDIVGIVVEPLQGAGGHRIAQPRFYAELSHLAHKYDVYLGFDEVQTAGGQTGSFFAIDQFDLPYPPQAVAVAKKVGCGAVYMREHMRDRNVLDSTWGGTLADMVRFVQEMRIVRDERLIEQVPTKGARLEQVLRGLAEEFPALMHNVRGLGLYQGFSLRLPEQQRLLRRVALQREGVVLLGAGPDTIRLRPNLSVTLEEIDELGARLRRALQVVSMETEGASTAERSDQS